MPARICFFIFLFGAKLLFAQEDVLQKRISLVLENVSLEEAFREISFSSGVNFSYNARHVQTEKRIDLNYTNETLRKILDHICDHYELEFTVVSQQIVIRKARRKADQEVRFTLSGHVRDKATGETLPGASILVKASQTGAITNSYGFFSLNLPAGEYELVFSFVGYQSLVRVISLKQNLRHNIELETDSKILEEVTVIADEVLENLQKSQSSRIQVNPRSLELLPEFAGENGLIKSLQTLPGIQTHSDGSAFYFVRGGNKDQNLILVDEAPVYNPAHLFGFYSVIIPDVAKEINIYKADLPIEKSGRLSSLIDVQTRDGNMKKFNVEGVLNPLLYRFSIESPIVKEKSSFFTSLRRSNFEWLYRKQAPNSDMHILDFNAKINWRINDQNRVFFSVFRGNDNYTGTGNQGKVGVAWHNYTATMRWNHIFNARLFSNLTLYASQYNYTLFTGVLPWQSGISDVSLRYDFSLFSNPDLTWRFGFSQTIHDFNPGNFTGVSVDISPFVPRVYAGKASETVLYLSREQRINDRWALRAGLRLPLWVNQGPSRVFLFDENRQVTDTLIFQVGQPISAYLIPELRLSARYRLDAFSSIRFSWGNYQQNIHLLSNSLSPFSSFEIWLPSGKNIKPQQARQFTAGINRFFPQRGIEIEAEIYNKRMFNQIEYVNHARLLLNPLLEGQLIFGESHARGLELSFKLKKGKVTGWASYTWSRVFNRFEGINNNEKYPAYYDRPLDLSFFLSWQAAKRLALSLNWLYHTGSAITTPTSFYNYDGSVVPVYGKKNNDRLPNYHRLDFSLNWLLGRSEGRYQHSLNFGIYNLYNRINPMAINFNKIETRDGNFVVPANYYGTHEIFSTQRFLGGIMPSITYKFRFE
jgi:hypothetical protein